MREGWGGMRDPWRIPYSAAHSQAVQCETWQKRQRHMADGPQRADAASTSLPRCGRDGEVCATPGGCDTVQLAAKPYVRDLTKKGKDGPADQLNRADLARTPLPRWRGGGDGRCSHLRPNARGCNTAHNGVVSGGMPMRLLSFRRRPMSGDGEGGGERAR